MTLVTPAAYATAIACVAVVVSSAGFVGRTGQRWLLPEAPTGLRLAVGAVLGVGFVLLVAELLGAAGWFSRWPLVVITGVVGIAAAATGRRLPALASALRRGRGRRFASVAAMVCVALVAVEVVTAITGTVRTGIGFLDATQYHLVWAAHFATTRSTTSYVHTGIGDTTTYYPLNDELLHAVGMVAVGRDTLSLLSPGAEIALTFAAAYAVGERYGEGAMAVCAVSPLAATFGSLDASAINDWAALWPFLAAVAVVLHGGASAAVRGRIAVVAGLGLGLAIGTKLDMLVPGFLLGVGLVVISRGRRARNGCLVVTAAVITGGFWLIRNIVAVGSPIPAVHLPGLPRIPFSVTSSISASVAHYATNVHVWRTWFVPGLRVYLGDAWPVVLLLSALGIVIAAVRPRGAGYRMVATVAALAGIAYLFTPTTAGGPEGQPFVFVFNIRYGLAALSVGLLLLCSTTPARRLRSPLCLLFVAVLVVELTERSNWAAGRRVALIAAAIVAITVVGATVLAALPGRPSTTRFAASVVVIAAVVVGSYPLQQFYLRHRYAAPPRAAVAVAGATSPTAVMGLFSSLDHINGVHIGVVGRPSSYPFLGPQWHNTVMLLGQSLPRHAFENYSTCAAWRQASGAVNFVVIENTFGRPPQALTWTRSDPAAHLVYEDAAGAVFRIDPGYASAPC